MGNCIFMSLALRAGGLAAIGQYTTGGLGPIGLNPEPTILPPRTVGKLSSRYRLTASLRGVCGPQLIFEPVGLGFNR